MEKITEILFAKVVTTGGRDLGRVFDVRSSGEPEHGFTNEERAVSELLCGSSGLLEMLGFKKKSVERVAWSAVKAFENGKIIVDENYRSGESKTLSNQFAPED